MQFQKNFVPITIALWLKQFSGLNAIQFVKTGWGKGKLLCNNGKLIDQRLLWINTHVDYEASQIRNFI